MYRDVPALMTRLQKEILYAEDIFLNFRRSRSRREKCSKSCWKAQLSCSGMIYDTSIRFMLEWRERACFHASRKSQTAFEQMKCVTTSILTLAMIRTSTCLCRRISRASTASLLRSCSDRRESSNHSVVIELL